MEALLIHFGGAKCTLLAMPNFGDAVRGYPFWKTGNWEKPRREATIAISIACCVLIP
jgi:hypothetical protein